MSVSYAAVIVVGLPRDEVDEVFIDSGELEVIDPYYDGGKHATVGICVAWSDFYLPTELGDLLVLDKEIGTAIRRFHNITGKVPKVYLTPHGV